jgi:Putative beta-barrel porin 2
MQFWKMSAQLLLIGFFAQLASQHALAQPSDRKALEPSVTQLLVHESNLFREPDGLESFGIKARSGSISLTRLQLNWNHATGMQSYDASASIDRLIYPSLSELNHVAYKLSGRWNWAMPDDWNGRIELGLAKTQPSRTELNGAEENLQNRRTLNIEARKSLSPQWQAYVGLEKLQRENSAPLRKFADYDELILETGLRYRPSPSLIGIFGVRQIDGTYGDIDLNKDRFRQFELVGSIGHEITDKSYLTINGRSKNRSYNNRKLRDFSGPTVEVSHQWIATGALNLKTTIGLGTDATSEVDASYARGNNISLSPTWLVSAKTQVDASLDWAKRSYKNRVNNSLFTAISIPSETTNQLGVGITYAILPTLTASGRLAHEQRRSDNQLREYRNRGLTLTFRLQL